MPQLLLQTPPGEERLERAWALNRSRVKEPGATGSGFEQTNCKELFWGRVEKAKHRLGLVFCCCFFKSSSVRFFTDVFMTCSGVFL